MVPDSKLQVDNVVPDKRKIEEIIALQIACTAEQMEAKEISVPFAKSLHELLQCAFENARNGFWLVICDLLEQALLDLLCGDVTEKIFKKHISIHFHCGDGAARVCGNLLPSKAFTSVITAFISADLTKLSLHNALPTKWRSI